MPRFVYARLQERVEAGMSKINNDFKNARTYAIQKERKRILKVKNFVESLPKPKRKWFEANLNALPFDVRLLIRLNRTHAL